MLDNSIWPDSKYDEIARQLVQYQRRLIEYQIIKYTQYGYVFYDYDGTTGFDLYYRLNKNDKKRISEIAQYLIGGIK